MEDHAYKPIIDFDHIDECLVKDYSKEPGFDKIFKDYQKDPVNWMLNQYPDKWEIFPIATTSKTKYGYRVHKVLEKRWVDGKCRSKQEARKVVAHLLTIDNEERKEDLKKKMGLKDMPF